jgi:hypothetical protein
MGVEVAMCCNWREKSWLQSVATRERRRKAAPVDVPGIERKNFSESLPFADESRRGHHLWETANSIRRLSHRISYSLFIHLAEDKLLYEESRLCLLIVINV